MATDETSWRTANFRQSVVAKIEEAIRSSGMPTSKNSMEMESHVFQKAKTKEEYLGFVARLILHVREMNSKKNPGMGGQPGAAGQNMQDPINALQTLARQGTGNQMMGLVPPQGPTQVTATNLLQTLNQRPGNQQRMQAPVQVQPEIMIKEERMDDEVEVLQSIEGLQNINWIEETTLHPPLASSYPTPLPNKRRASQSSRIDCEIENLQNSSECLAPASNKVHSDEVDVFLEYVAGHLRSLPIRNRLICQEKIISMVTKERLKLLEPPGPSSSKLSRSSSSSSSDSDGGRNVEISIH